MLNIPSKIIKRHVKLSKDYEKLHKRAERLDDERIKFNKPLTAFIKKFSASEDAMIEFEKKYGISPSGEYRVKNWNEAVLKIDAFFATYLVYITAHNDFLQNVIYFNDYTYDNTLVDLLESEGKPAVSEKIMIELEKEFDALQDEYTSMLKSMTDLKSKFKEVLKIYRSLFN